MIASHTLTVRRLSTAAIRPAVFGSAAVIYLVVEYPQHVGGNLPVLLLLASPMYLFKYGNHSEHE